MLSRNVLQTGKKLSQKNEEMCQKVKELLSHFAYNPDFASTIISSCQYYVYAASIILNFNKNFKNSKTKCLNFLLLKTKINTKAGLNSLHNLTIT